MKPFLFVLLGLASLPPAGAAAAESAPLFYTRADVRIVRASPPAGTFLPWEDKSHGDKGVVISAEMQDGAAMYRQKGWFNLSSPSEDGGVLLTFAAPTVAPVAPSAQYAPLDILMIDREGRIAQIVPNILLSDLQEDIYPAQPILAMLFLQGGLCGKLNIRPGDHVEHPLFRKPPTVLTAPPPVAPVAPVAPDGAP